MNNLFDVQEDHLDGFYAFWSLYPRDRRRPGRKAGKGKCQRIWKAKKLWKVRDQVIAALKEDIKAMTKGAHRLSEDHMYYFPGIQPWLNQERWDRDIEPEKPKRMKADESAIVRHSPPRPLLTPEEKATMLPVWRAIAERRAMPWPR